MIKVGNKKLSMLLALAVLMTMFVGVGAASASENIIFTPINAPVYSISTNPQSADAEILVCANEALIFGKRMNRATIKLPQGVEFKEGVSNVRFTVENTDPGFTAVGASIESKAAADIWVDTTGGLCEGETKFRLVFSGLVIKSGFGDLNVTMVSPSGNAFPAMETIKIAAIAGQGSVNIVAGSKATLGDGGGELDAILIAETAAGVFEPGETIELSLPAGFAWNDSNVLSIPGAWALTGKSYDWAIDPDNERILEVYIGDNVSTDSAGRINLGSNTGGYFAIDVEKNAIHGDIYITVSSDKGAVEVTKIVVAEYVGLESIAITNPADKLIYTVDDSLDITGLVVTGTYSDNSTRAESITADNITGFNSSFINPALILTITIGDKTTTYTVEIKAARIVAVTPDSPTVTVTETDTSIRITVPASVTEAVLETTPTVNGETASVTLPQISAASNTSQGDIEVRIPYGTQVSGSSAWNGIINLPQVVSDVVVPGVATVSAAVEIGADDNPLTLSQPIRILLAGQGGKNAGWLRNGKFTPITYQMEYDSAAALGTNDDGYITVGNDLVIWTTHLTTFVTYNVDECFIATAAFGSKFDWPVALLRHFRDQYLLTNSLGTAFVRFYYQHSPPIAERIASSQPLKMLVRVLLAPVIFIVYMIYHPMLMGTVMVLLCLFLAYWIRLSRNRYAQA